MKNLYIALSFLSVMTFAQNYNGKVGINTTNPKQNLDIQGTLRVKEPGQATNNASPMAWNPSEGNEQGKIMYGSNTQQAPFRIVDYSFELSKASEDWINEANLGIPTDKYTVIIMHHSLVDDASSPVFMRILSTNNNASLTQPLYLGKAFDRGLPKVSGNTNDPTDDRIANFRDVTGKVATAAPIVMVYPKNGSWHIYADYPSTSPLTFHYESYNPLKVKTGKNGSPIDINRTFTWDISFLIVDNSYLKYLPETTISVGQNNKGRSNIDAVTRQSR